MTQLWITDVGECTRTVLWLVLATQPHPVMHDANQANACKYFETEEAAAAVFFVSASGRVSIDDLLKRTQWDTELLPKRHFESLGAAIVDCRWKTVHACEKDAWAGVKLKELI